MKNDRILHPMPRNQVRLLDSPIKDRQTRNGEYLRSLDVDRLLHNFRTNAGIPSSAQPYGGWESPDCGLRGHFVGHYLSACAFMWSSTGDDHFRERAHEMILGLQECQRSLEGGYLSAFPCDVFDVLEAKFSGVWAPYYTLHKLLAGLIDVFRETDFDVALEMARKVGDWVCHRLARLGSATLEPMLRTSELNPSNEYGGIGESLYDLFAITSDEKYLCTAKLFDRDWFLGPLTNGRDELAGLHANTHIPQVIAALKRYRATGEQNYLRAANLFWQQTAKQRSYVNGGSSGPRPDRKERSEGGEHWPEASRLEGTLTPKINESCVVHNMIRLTDLLAEVHGDAQYADFRERAWLNDVLGMQHPTTRGGYIYSHPLCGCRKIFGEAESAFWCCYGTTVEAYGRLADSVYYRTVDGCVVNQFVASTLCLSDSEVTIEQRTRFPYEPRTTLFFRSQSDVELTLRIRVPAWCERVSIRVNDRTIEHVVEDRYLILKRTWQLNDRVEVDLPMQLHVETLPGDPQMAAILYGPLVLAARTAHAAEVGCQVSELLSHVRTIDLAELIFSLRLVFGGEVPFVPLCEIADEPFSAYIRTRPSTCSDLH